MVGPHTIPFDLCFSLVVFALGTEPGLLVKDGGDVDRDRNGLCAVPPQVFIVDTDRRVQGLPYSFGFP
jgi:hypothetical protein